MFPSGPIILNFFTVTPKISSKHSTSTIAESLHIQNKKQLACAHRFLASTNYAIVQVKNIPMTQRIKKRSCHAPKIQIPIPRTKNSWKNPSGERNPRIPKKSRVGIAATAVPATVIKTLMRNRIVLSADCPRFCGYHYSFDNFCQI